MTKVSGAVYLVELHMESKVQLEDGFVWSLDFAEDGTAFVSNGQDGGSLWCADLFEDECELDPVSGRVVVITTTGRMPIEKYRQRFSTLIVPVRSSLSNTPVDLNTYVFRQSCGGILGSLGAQHAVRCSDWLPRRHDSEQVVSELVGLVGQNNILLRS